MFYVVVEGFDNLFFEVFVVRVSRYYECVLFFGEFIVCEVENVYFYIGGY